MIEGIVASISALKSVTEIAKVIQGSTKTMSEAELELKFANLYKSLAVAELSQAGLQSAILLKDQEINELKTKLKVKSKTVGFKQARYLVDSDGAPYGQPFCSVCYHAEQALIPLLQGLNAHHTNCNKCKAVISTNRAPQNATEYIIQEKAACKEHGIEFKLNLLP